MLENEDPKDHIVEMGSMVINEPTNYPAKVKKLIYELFRDGLIKTENEYSRYDFYVVWFCKTLQNWKALVSTTLEDGLYIEVTHDGDKKRTYVDVYKKTNHFVISDDFANENAKEK